MEYNIYCDESCHLSSNNSNYMLIGAISCPKHSVKQINTQIQKLKAKYNLSKNIELKWNKIDKKTEQLYVDLINFFFHNENLRFRTIIIKKDQLNHKKYNQTENQFYHKVYYLMLKYIITAGNSYNIYPDIKDTHSYYNHQVTLGFLRNNFGDFNKKTILKNQPIKSYESPILQINDVLIGALSYYYRNLNTNNSKQKVIEAIKKNYNLPLDHSSPFDYCKFNLFLWRSNDGDN